MTNTLRVADYETSYETISKSVAKVNVLLTVARGQHNSPLLYYKSGKFDFPTQPLFGAREFSQAAFRGLLYLNDISSLPVGGEWVVNNN